MFADRYHPTAVAPAPAPAVPNQGFLLLPQQPQSTACPWLYFQAFENACREVYAAKRARLLEPCWN